MVESGAPSAQRTRESAEGADPVPPSEGLKQRWPWIDDLIGAVVFAAGSLGVAWFLSYVATSGEAFGPPQRLLLDVSPRVFLAGIAALGIYASALFWLARRLSRVRRTLLIASLPVVFLACGLVLVSLRPGTAQVVGLEYVPPTPPMNTANYVLVVLFETGRDSLSLEEQRRIRDSLVVFGVCNSSALTVRGFASSTPFRVVLKEGDRECDSACLNWRLANRRALRVEAFLKDQLSYSATARTWAAPSELEAMRLRDTVSGTVVRNLERLNRRAEISWASTGC